MDTDNKVELIDRVKLMEELRLIDWNYIATRSGGDLRDGIDQMFELISEAPVIEATPTVHGRWINDRAEAGCPLTGDMYLMEVMQCSVCGTYFDVSDARTYCPHCGAIMGLVEE